MCVRERERERERERYVCVEIIACDQLNLPPFTHKCTHAHAHILTHSQEFAEKFEMQYFETSAKDSVNVNELFTALTREIMESSATGMGGASDRGNTGETIQIRSAARGRKESEPGGKGKCCSKT